MDADFWHEKWNANSIGFHQSDTNPLLAAHFGDLAIAERGRVFVPLCGKTLDIAWLLSRGYRVAGAELSELAVSELFESLGIEPDVTGIGALKRYSGKDIDIFAGDIFELTRGSLGEVDAVFDRAALVALPEDMRVRYARHLTDITGNAPQLLITFQYDQTLMKGPPFSVSDEEVRRHYAERYDIKLLTRADVEGGLKGRCAALEVAWLLDNLPNNAT